MGLVGAVLERSGEGWSQIADLLIAFGLSSLVGLERQLRGKSVGLRTQAIVGTAAALVVLVSKYGFSDVLSSKLVVLDPSRVAAQIVSGIGFLGAGLILTRQGAVRGLTTAAAVWETAAIGMAAGAGLPVLAAVVVGLHLVIVSAYTWLDRSAVLRQAGSLELRVTYQDGRGNLRDLLRRCTEAGWKVVGLGTGEGDDGNVHELLDGADGKGPVTVNLRISGSRLETAAEALSAVEGVRSVRVLSRQADE